MPRKVLYSGLGAVRLAARQPKASAAGVPRLPENRTKGSHCKGHRGINAQAGDSAIRFSGQWFFPSIHPVHVVHIRQLRITSPPIWVFQIAQDLCASAFNEGKRYPSPIGKTVCPHRKRDCLCFETAPSAYGLWETSPVIQGG